MPRAFSPACEASQKERGPGQGEVELLQFGKRKPPRDIRSLHNLTDVWMHKLHLFAAATPQLPPCIVVLGAQQSALSPRQLTASPDDPVGVYLSLGRLPAQGDSFIYEAGCRVCSDGL